MDSGGRRHTDRRDLDGAQLRVHHDANLLPLARCRIKPRRPRAARGRALGIVINRTLRLAAWGSFCTQEVQLPAPHRHDAHHRHCDGPGMCWNNNLTCTFEVGPTGLEPMTSTV